MIYTAVAASSSLHKVACAPGPGDTGRTSFDDGPWLDWPAYGLHVRLAANWTHVVAVAKGHVGGQLIVGNQLGAVRVLGPVHGDYAVGIEALADGTFRVGCVLPGGVTWRSWIVSGDLASVTEEGTHDGPTGGTSQGWTEFPAVWADARRTITINGLQLGLAKRAGRFTVGQSSRWWGMDAWDHEQHCAVRVSDINSPVQPDIACLPDGRALVAICSDGGAFVPSEAFNANWVAPVEPVAVPIFEPQPISCVPFDALLLGPDVPQIVGGGGEDAGDIRYVFFTVGRPGETVDLTWDKAATHHAKTLAYYDGQWLTMQNDGADVIGVQCYPNGKQSAGTLESIPDMLARLENNRTEARRSGRAYVWVVPVYTGSGEWPLAHVFACQTWAFGRDGVDIVPYGHHRPPFIEAIKESLRRMLAAATAPKPVVVPPVPVTPPVTPTPTPIPVPVTPLPPVVVPPKPTLPKPTNYNSAKAGAVVAAIAALIGWFRRKKG